MANHATSRRRNKPYRPQPVNRLGGLAAINLKLMQAEDALPIADDDRTDLQLAYWIGFNEMTQGVSSEEHWTMVTVSLNIALVLSEQGVRSQYTPYIVKALEGAFRAHVRAQRTGAWRYDGEAIAAIRDALEVHDEQVPLVSKEQMRAALHEVRRRVDTGNVYQSAPPAPSSPVTPSSGVSHEHR
jgi:hypothetical protein